LHFFNSDICPYAQRTWIALLEKEDDPHHPKYFDLEEINFFNRDLPATQRFLKVATTVPAGIHNGHEFYESQSFNEYVNEAINPAKSLLPGNAAERFKARQFMDKHRDVCGALYKIMTAQEEKARGDAVEATLTQLRKFNDDLVLPYATGEHFTLADIAFAGFFERLVVMGEVSNFRIPETEEYKKVNEWMKNVFARESVKITMADRTDESMNTHPFGPRNRKEYLKEIARLYTSGNYAAVRALISKAPAGKTVDLSNI